MSLSLQSARDLLLVAASPVPPTGPIKSLDVLPGFAVPGILIMNIRSFSMIGSVYMNPDSCGELSGTNRAIWYGRHLLAGSKFITLFAILFFAWILPAGDRRRQSGKSSAMLHNRRMLGLFGIGMHHAYLSEYREILVPYATSGSIVFLAWTVRVRWRVLGSGTLLLIGWSLQFMPASE